MFILLVFVVLITFAIFPPLGLVLGVVGIALGVPLGVFNLVSRTMDLDVCLTREEIDRENDW